MLSRRANDLMTQSQSTCKGHAAACLTFAAENFWLAFFCGVTAPEQLCIDTPL